MSNILGLGLIIASIYFLGQNIVFTTHYYYNWWQKIPAAGSVIALLLGVASLTFWQRWGTWAGDLSPWELSSSS